MDVKTNMINSLKWSIITEILVKLISPITNMILARILAPNEFGVIATVTMVFSFADMLTDAGFQKYLIQHEFKNKEELNKATNVAFWSNLFLSIILLIIISIFNQNLAKILGNKNLGTAIIISCLSLPLTSLSSIQLARIKRDFGFKTIFKARLIAALIPFFITIPLALLNFSYWSIIIGNICGNLFNAIILTLYSPWKPQIYYNINLLKEMFSYCFWTLVDSIAVWFTTWIDIFIIGFFLSDYYLGLYKNSMNMVNALLALITSALIPVLFVSLSKYQNNSEKMVKLFLKSQKYLSVFIVPIGVGLFLYSKLATQIMLGSNWLEARNIIGIWSLASIFRICFVSINSELYRASGNPKIPVYLQLLDLILLIVACYISIKKGFWYFVYCRAIMRLDLIIPNIIILKRKYKVNILSFIKSFIPITLSTTIMIIVSIILKQISSSILWSFISIFICATVYILSIIFNPTNKDDIKAIKTLLLKKKGINKEIIIKNS